MKKFRKSLSFLLASTVLFSLFSASGCQSHKSDESSLSAPSSLSESTSSESTSVTTSTQETSTETTGENTATSEPSETTTAPIEDSSSGVKVHWNTYDPSVKKYPDPIVNWLDGKPSYDFKTSSDYGTIYFYEGWSNRTYYGSTLKTIGCIDASGRVICAPIFDEEWLVSDPITDKYIGNIVIKHLDTDSTDSKKAHLIYQKVGFLSDDGSVYSGLQYDDFCFEEEKFFFMNYTQDGVLFTPFDTKTGETGTSFELKFDYSKVPSDMGFSSLIHDRYLVFMPNYWIDSDNPYDENASVLFDGQTGKEIPTSDNQFIFDGALLKEERSENYNYGDTDASATYTITDYDGKELWKGTYHEFSKISSDRILFGAKDHWDVLDLQGNLIGSLKSGDQYIGSCTDSIVYSYNSKIHLRVSFPNASVPEGYIEEFYTFDQDLHPISDTEPNIFENAGPQSSDDDYVIKNEGSIQLLDPSDHHVIKEFSGVDDFSFRGDQEDPRKYLVLSKWSEEKWRYDFVDIVDSKTGESYFTNPVAKEYLDLCVNPDYITDQSVYFTNGENSLLIGKDGKVLFLWNTFSNNEEHYFDYYWMEDDEPDIP